MWEKRNYRNNNNFFGLEDNRNKWLKHQVPEDMAMRDHAAGVTECGTMDVRKWVKKELGYRDATASKIIRKISLDLGWGDKTLKLVQNNGIGLLLKGHSTYRVFIKYCIIFEDFKNIPDSCLSLFYLGVIVCTHTRQVEHQLFSRTGRVQKNHKILRKKHNI